MGDERFLYQILYLLHGRGFIPFQRTACNLLGQLVQLLRRKPFLCQTYIRFKNSAADLGSVKGRQLTAALADLWFHRWASAFLYEICPVDSGQIISIVLPYTVNVKKHFRVKFYILCK